MDFNMRGKLADECHSGKWSPNSTNYACNLSTRGQILCFMRFRRGVLDTHSMKPQVDLSVLSLWALQQNYSKWPHTFSIDETASWFIFAESWSRTTASDSTHFQLMKPQIDSSPRRVTTQQQVKKIRSHDLYSGLESGLGIKVKYLNATPFMRLLCWAGSHQGKRFAAPRSY